MKQLAILIFILCQVTIVNGQYNFNTQSIPYQELINPISLNQGQVWNEGSNFPIYFNFNFSIGGQTYSAVNVVAGGGLNFPGLGIKELFIFHTPFGGYLLSDKDSTISKSDISYEIIGNSGQQILKVQWKNAGFVQWYSTSDTSDFVDFQIWLFESDNHIEVHFGSSATDPGTYGYPVATSDSNPGTSFKFLFDTCSNMFGLDGPANLPSYLFFNSCIPSYVFVDGTPSSGITYVINPLGVGLNEIDRLDFSIYPNPATEFIQISNYPNKFKLSRIEVVDIMGRIIMKVDNSVLMFLDYTIPVNNLDVGTYILNVYDQKGIVSSRKFIKKSS